MQDKVKTNQIERFVYKQTDLPEDVKISPIIMLIHVVVLLCGAQIMTILKLYNIISSNDKLIFYLCLYALCVVGSCVRYVDTISRNHKYRINAYYYNIDKSKASKRIFDHWSLTLSELAHSTGTCEDLWSMSYKLDAINNSRLIGLDVSPDYVMVYELYYNNDLITTLTVAKRDYDMYTGFNKSYFTKNDKLFAEICRKLIKHRG